MSHVTRHTSPRASLLRDSGLREVSPPSLGLRPERAIVQALLMKDTDQACTYLLVELRQAPSRILLIFARCRDRSLTPPLWCPLRWRVQFA